MDFPVYCEQPCCNGFFEPVNTLTNLAFIIAGIVLIFQLRSKRKLDIKGIYFSSLIIIIGIGSLAWHFYRTRFTLTIDSLPIGLFILSYLVFYTGLMSRKLIIRLLFFTGFFFYTFFIIRFIRAVYKPLPSMLENGGLEYFTAISYFLVIQIYNAFNNKRLIRYSLAIFLVFTLSLTFRQIDLIVCNVIGFGMHFMWHILNAVVLYLFVRLLYKDIPHQST